MKILLLGATGSIGASACACIRRHPDRFELVGVSANRNGGSLASIVKEFNTPAACVCSDSTARQVQTELPASVHFFSGVEGLERMVRELDYDLLLNALVGAVGLRPTVAALKRNKRVALANKESLVIGGDLIQSLLDTPNGGQLLPVDSEHSAILQCLQGEDRSAIEELILTASGGPFRTLPRDQFNAITPEQALKHPTWAMGKKITIDAATLVNKGFELIEAYYLFRTPYDRLRVVIHPQSIIHSMVVYHDGAVMAQAGLPDMELPIQFALSYPQRLPMPGKRLDLAHIGSLTFFEPDEQRFPCLRLCRQAGESGGVTPATLNAANEVAVHQFLAGNISFTQIADVIAAALDKHRPGAAQDLESIEEQDAWARRFALDCIRSLEKHA
jgi:1-deoxy-D-xylulose-5-phosphate reductoisomerase